MDVQTVDFDYPLIRTQLAADELEQGCLTGATRPHDSGNTATRDIQRDTIEYFSITTTEMQIPYFDQNIAQLSAQLNLLLTLLF